MRDYGDHINNIQAQRVFEGEKREMLGRNESQKELGGTDKVDIRSR